MTEYKIKAFLDTAFLINLVDPNKPYHKNALDYFKAFLANRVDLYISTIALAEFCILGNATDLPLDNFKLVAFDMQDSLNTGKLARRIFDRHKAKEPNIQRKVITDDTKLLSQAQRLSVDCYVSNDDNCESTFKQLKNESLVNYEFFNIRMECSTNFGLLPNMNPEEINLKDYFRALRKTKSTRV